MDMRRLRYFVAAADLGTLSRAAARCGVTQPSLSQQIQRLEAAVGVRLFDRLGRGIALTDAGKALLPRARRILAEIDEVQAHLKRDAETAGALSIGAIPTMAPYVLPPALRSLRDKRPALDLAIHELTTEDAIDALLAMKIDCAIMSLPVDHDLLAIQHLGHDELLAVVPIDHELASESECAWNRLRGQPTVTLHEMHCLSRQIEALCATRGAALRTVCRSSQLATVFELVAAGLGISVVPEMAAARHAHAGVRFVRISQQKPIRPVVLAWHRERSRSGPVDLLVSIIVNGFRDGVHRMRG